MKNGFLCYVLSQIKAIFSVKVHAECVVSETKLQSIYNHGFQRKVA